jgi:hypothetical protein
MFLCVVNGAANNVSNVFRRMRYIGIRGVTPRDMGFSQFAYLLIREYERVLKGYRGSMGGMGRMS